MRALVVLLALSASAVAAPKDTFIYLYIDSDSDVVADITLNDALISPGAKIYRTAQHMDLLRPDRLGDSNHLCFTSQKPATWSVTVTLSHKGDVATKDRGAVALRGGKKLGDETTVVVGIKPVCVDFTLAGFGTPAPGSKEPVSASELRDYGVKLIGLVKSKSTDKLMTEWRIPIAAMVQAGMGTEADARAQLGQAITELEGGSLVSVAPADIHGLKVGPGERYRIVVGALNNPLLATQRMAMTPIVEKRGGVLTIVESR